MKATILIACMTLAPLPALAGCGPVPDITTRMDDLLDRMQTAPDAGAADAVNAQMWALWTKAPDEAAQTLLDEGMSRRGVFDLDGAIKAMDALVARCPDYAEGYNQRAFAHFLREDYAAALPDLDRALALNPRHIGALSGKGLTLIRMGRIRDGQDAIRAALDLNPWLSERALLELEPEDTEL